MCPVPGHSSSSDWWSVRSPYRPVRSSPSMTGVPPGCESQLPLDQQTACPWWDPYGPLSWLWDGRGWRGCHLSGYESRFLLFLCLRHVKESHKEHWSNDAALFHATADFECLREAAIDLHCSLRVSMESLDHALQFGWATDLWRTLKRPSLLTRSNALVRSMKAMYKGICCSLHFSCNCRREKIMSIVDRSARKPHCDSG